MYSSVNLHHNKCNPVVANFHQFSNMRTLLSALLSLFIVASISAQNIKNRVISIPAQKHGKPLQDPWTGGLNSPQLSECDLNLDGIPDLVAFDRVANKLSTYLNRGDGSDTTYYYAPQYEEMFPDTMVSWMLMADYNHDSIADIFTYGGAGTRVYKGRIQDDTLLKFDVVMPLLLYRFDNTSYPYIWTSIDDVPAFVDVNFDGDIDVLTFDVLGGSTIQYFENQTMENIGNPAFAIDSFKYELVTKCWGNVAESNLDNSIVLNISCKGTGEQEANSGYESRHAGSTIFAVDEGNDHDIDLLLGDISFNNMVLLRNCGDSSYANVCSYDTAYPTCNVPVTLPIFPAGFGIDANNDGYRDLLIAPNARTSARDINNLYYYKNVNDVNCTFELQTDSFVVDQSYDFGTDSKPVLFDYNGDGLMDIVVGNYGYFRPFMTYKSTLAVLENIGTQSSPSFRLRTDDYQNISAYARIGVHPTFGDMDDDGLQDLIIGDHQGYIHYLKNVGATVASFPTITSAQYFGLDVGEYAAPCIYDMNGDGLKDLVVGKLNGKVNYYWNFGTTTNAQFSQDSVNTNFGNINVAVGSSSLNYSTPSIMRDENNDLAIYVGSARGTIYKYIVNTANLRSGSFNLVTDNYLKEDLGFKSTIAIGDLNNDGNWEYITGNSRGGLAIYSDSLWNPGTTLNLPTAINEARDAGHIMLYPNPAKSYINIRLSKGAFVSPEVEIYNVIGERFATEFTTNANVIILNTNNLHTGMYFVRIIGMGNAYTARVIIE